MTQNDKDLLLRDLCARLPYSVKGRVSRRDHNNRECEFVKTIDGKLYDRFAVAQESWYDNVTIKPYLFPLSSMTEEQKEFIKNKFCYDLDIDDHPYSLWAHCINIGDIDELIDWFHKNHIDY